MEGLVKSHRSASEIGQRVPQREKQETALPTTGSKPVAQRRPDQPRNSLFRRPQPAWWAPAQAAADVRLTARPASIKPRGVCPAEPEKIRSVAAKALAIAGANPNRPTFK